MPLYAPYFIERKTQGVRKALIYMVGLRLVAFCNSTETSTTLVRKALIYMVGLRRQFLRPGLEYFFVRKALIYMVGLRLFCISYAPAAPMTVRKALIYMVGLRLNT